MWVYIWTDALECDFRESDHWFTYLGSSRSNAASQGRDSTHWLYITYNNTANIQWFFQVPSSIYNQWQIKKIEFETYSSIQQTWPWFFEINSNIDRMNSSRNAFRVRYTSVQYWYDWTRSEVVVSWTPSWTFTTTFDFDNSEAYISTESNNKLSISSSAITLFKSLRSQWKLAIALCKWWASWTAYLEKVKFYIS